MDNEVERFDVACEKMCNSKFIFFDKRISEVLKSIAMAPAIYNVIAGCMLNFNFKKELGVATTIEGRFTAPNNSDKFVALAFCLMNALDDKKVDINALLARSFASEGANSYSNFCEAVVKRFKETVLLKLGEEKQTDAQPQATQGEISTEVTERLDFLLENLKPTLSKKTNEKLYFECLKAAVAEKNKKFAIGFLTAMREHNRKGRKTLSEIEQIINTEKGRKE